MKNDQASMPLKVVRFKVIRRIGSVEQQAFGPVDAQPFLPKLFR